MNKSPDAAPDPEGVGEKPAHKMEPKPDDSGLINKPVLKKPPKPDPEVDDLGRDRSCVKILQFLSI